MVGGVWGVGGGELGENWEVGFCLSCPLSTIRAKGVFWLALVFWAWTLFKRYEV